MKLKLSKDIEYGLIGLIVIILGKTIPLLEIDYFKEVNTIIYIFTSIVTLSAFVLFLSKVEIKGFKFKTFRTLIIFLLFLILQILIGKTVLIGIIVNFICFTIDISIYYYSKAKDKEEEKEGNKQ